MGFLDDIDQTIFFAPGWRGRVAKNVGTGERVNRARQNKHCRFAFMAARIFGQKITRHFFDFGKSRE